MSTLQHVKWGELEQRLRGRMKDIPHGGKGQLAKFLEVTPTHLSQVISGNRHISRELAEKIMDYYGMELDYSSKGGEL